MVVITYVDDCLIFSPSGSDVAYGLITSLQEGNENFVFTDQGSIETYLGMDIKHQNVHGPSRHPDTFGVAMRFPKDSK